MLEINDYEVKIEESEKAGSTTCTVYIEDCEGLWMSGCRGSVAEHWRLKPEVSQVRLTAAAAFFHFPLFSPHNFKFNYHFLVTSLITSRVVTH